MSKRKCSSVDAILSGQRLHSIMVENGYSVEELQEILYMSCPQTIYRWFNGDAIPSIDNLYMMSKLFGVHMEDMLVERKSTPTKRSCWDILDEETRIKKQISKLIVAETYMLLDNIDIKLLKRLFSVIYDIKKNQKTQQEEWHDKNAMK